jgi:hypothetical protein
MAQRSFVRSRRWHADRKDVQAVDEIRSCVPAAIAADTFRCAGRKNGPRLSQTAGSGGWRRRRYSWNRGYRSTLFAWSRTGPAVPHGRQVGSCSSCPGAKPGSASFAARSRSGGVWNNRLARLDVERHAIDPHGDHIRFE